MSSKIYFARKLVVVSSITLNMMCVSKWERPLEFNASSCNRKRNFSNKNFFFFFFFFLYFNMIFKKIIIKWVAIKKNRNDTKRVIKLSYYGSPTITSRRSIKFIYLSLLVFRKIIFIFYLRKINRIINFFFLVIKIHFLKTSQ